MNARFRYPFAVNAEAGRLQQEPDYDAYIRQLILQVLLRLPASGSIGRTWVRA